MSFTNISCWLLFMSNYPELPVVSNSLNADIMPVVIAFSGPRQLYTQQASSNSDSILCADSDRPLAKQIVYTKLVSLLTLAGDWVWATSASGGKTGIHITHMVQ